jgi:hypothetical protein
MAHETDATRREGRLRPEFEGWYPALRADRWYPADQLTAIVLTQLRSGAPKWHSEDRVPSNAHFEFRGGASHPGRSQLTRALDPPLDPPPTSARELPTGLP